MNPPSGRGGGASAVVVAGRSHRLHRPGRRHVVKVTYDDQEIAAIRAAAEGVGLTVSGYVGETAVAAARGVPSPVSDPFRAVVAELITIRTTLTVLATQLDPSVGQVEATSDTITDAVTLRTLTALLDRVDGVAERPATLSRRRIRG